MRGWLFHRFTQSRRSDLESAGLPAYSPAAGPAVSEHKRHHVRIHGMAPRVLDETEWDLLREMRLTALRDSPRAFLSSYSAELRYDEQEWRAEFARGEWTVEESNNKAIAFIGATQDHGTRPDECYLEYMWVAPGFRRRGMATGLIMHVLQRLLNRRFATVWLWVLDGNEPAKRLYEKCGFNSTMRTQRPCPDSSRSEELMRLTF